MVPAEALALELSVFAFSQLALDTCLSLPLAVVADNRVVRQHRDRDRVSRGARSVSLTRLRRPFRCVFGFRSAEARSFFVSSRSLANARRIRSTSCLVSS